MAIVLQLCLSLYTFVIDFLIISVLRLTMPANALLQSHPFFFFYMSHFSGTPLSKFSSLDLASLSKEVSLMKVATSIIDPIPTQLFKSCFASLGSVVLNIINDSFCVVEWCQQHLKLLL